MLPAAGQGALGIEVRADRADLIAALAPLAHAPTWAAVAAERAVSRAMGGSCSMPLAAHAVWAGTGLVLDAAWGEIDEVNEAGQTGQVGQAVHRGQEGESAQLAGPVRDLVTAHGEADLAGLGADAALAAAEALGTRTAAALCAAGARRLTV
jgi:hydroxymethylbilane synthase